MVVKESVVLSDSSSSIAMGSSLVMILKSLCKFR